MCVWVHMRFLYRVRFFFLFLSAVGELVMIGGSGCSHSLAAKLEGPVTF